MTERQSKGKGRKMKRTFEKCRMLYDYAVFVDTIRRYQKELPPGQAVETAINECIAGGVLADFLRENRAEVLKMGLYEYDEELHIRLEREEGEQKGKLFQMVLFVKRKYLKNKPISLIADELDEDIENIRGIYELIEQNPAQDEEWIVRELLNRR